MGIVRWVILGMLAAHMLASPVGAQQRESVPRSAEAAAANDVQALLRLAQEQVRAGQTDQALANYAAALAEARQLNSDAGRAQCLFIRACICSCMEKMQEARTLYEQALPVVRSLGPSSGVDEAALLFELGRACDDLGDPRPAIQHLEESYALCRANGNKRGMVQALCRLCLAYNKGGRTDLAFDRISKAADLARVIGDKPDLAVALYRKGAIMRVYGRPDEAQKLLEESLSLARRSRPEWVEATVTACLGSLMSMRGNKPGALKLVEQAIALIDGKDNEAEDNIRGVAASVLMEMGRPLEAKEQVLRALECARASGGKWHIATRSIHLGGVLNALSEPRAAIGEAETGLELGKQIGDPSLIGNALWTLANSYRLLGEHRRCLSLLADSARAFGSIQSRVMVIRARVEVGRTLGLMGYASESAARFQQGLPELRMLGEAGSEMSACIAFGDLWLSVEQPARAMAYYQRALAISRRHGIRVGEIESLLAAGRASMQSARSSDAFRFFDAARRLSHTIGSIHEGTALARMAEIARVRGDYAAASRYLRLARPILEPRAPANTQAAMYLELARLARLAGHWDEARADYVAASRLFQDWGAQASAWLASTELAGMLARLGRTDDAENLALAAARMVEERRAALGSEELSVRTSVAAQVAPYHQLIRLLSNKGVLAGAFEAAQKAKARALLTLQGHSQDNSELALSTSERADEQALRRRATALAVRAAEADSGPGSEARAARQKLVTQASESEQRLQWFYDRLRAQHPTHSRVAAARPASLGEIGRLLPAGSALLEFVCLSDIEGAAPPSGSQILLFVVAGRKGNAGISLHRIAIPNGDLTKRVASLRNALADRRGPWRSQAAALYARLVAPAAHDLAGVKRLIVCPDGPLWDIPFQALVDSKNRYWIETMEVDYAYSASAAYVALATKSGLPGRALRSGPLIVANPSFGRRAATASDARARGAAFCIPRGSKLTFLPGAAREAAVIRRLFPGSSSLTGARAQESAVKAQAGAYRRLHFATHGFALDAAPMLSSLALARPAKGSHEDGFLTAMEISRMSLPADLVVLSACDTARGEVRTGEGVVGLAWALQVAGTRTQVLTQWRVDDASTAALMGEFYGGLRKGRPKGQSLRHAALSLLRDRRYAHPYYWAPFILIGDWR